MNLSKRYVPLSRKTGFKFLSFRLFLFLPPPHISIFYGVTSSCTRLFMKTKHVCQNLIITQVNFHINRTMWSVIFLVKLCRWRVRKKSWVLVQYRATKAIEERSLHEKLTFNKAFRLRKLDFTKKFVPAFSFSSSLAMRVFLKLFSRIFSHFQSFRAKEKKNFNLVFFIFCLLFIVWR